MHTYQQICSCTNASDFSVEYLAKILERKLSLEKSSEVHRPKREPNET